MKRILPLLFSASLILAFSPVDAFAAPSNEPQPIDEPGSLSAQASNIASGVWGTCPWELSADGTLTVHPGVGPENSYDVPWDDYDYKGKIKAIVFASEDGAMVQAPMDCSYLFREYNYLNNASGVEFIDFTGFDTSKTTSMSNMFSGCSSLTTLDLSRFDTFRVRDMWGMFQECTSLESINLSSFDTSNVTNMSYMFENCHALKSLDLSSFDISKAGSISSMFTDCSSLATLDLSSFDTSKTYGFSIFTGCYELSRIIVGEKTLANLSLHDTKINGHTDWYSQTDKAWYTVEQINASRKNIADVYTKFEQDGPSIIGGNGATWQPGSNKPLAFRSSAAFADFERVEVDGSKVQASNYELREGSTVVELKPVYLSTLAAGKHSIGIVSKSGTASASFTIGQSSSNSGDSDGPSSSDNPGTSARTQVMYRLYNPNSGEHFYTASVLERDATVAAGWNYEGVGWTAPVTSATPVYRLYSGTDHHYCTGVGERDALIAAGWSYEGIGWYSDDAQGVPLYRQFNPNVDPNAPRNNSGSHNYTTDFGEHKSLVSIGWRDEGVGWYGVGK